MTVDFDQVTQQPVRDGLTIDEELESAGIRAERKSTDTDDPEVELRFRRVKAWRSQARSVQFDNRAERIKDHDFYDGEQWDEEDKEEVENRGQQASVFNIIKPTVDWITGTEKRTRVDYRVLPRRKEAANTASAKTETIKYVQDVNKGNFHRSLAFEDAVISGLGWLETGIRGDESDEPLFIRYEDWRYLWVDPLSTERDLSDARYLFREKWVDLDVACAMFPDKAADIKASCIDDDYYFDEDDGIDDEANPEAEIIGEGEENDTDAFMNRRSRVRMTECWYRVLESVKVMRGRDLGTLDGMVYDEQDDSHLALNMAGLASIYDAKRMRVRQMIFTNKYVLQDIPSPYRHDRFPFVPIWGFRKKRNNTPYGVVRNLRDPQQDLNKRRSKILYLLSVNRVVADEDATDDWDELWSEAQRPDGVVKKKRGTEVRIEGGEQLAREHVMLMEYDARYVEKTSGVTDENLGRETNASSGKAILARQEQGHTVTAGVFDNLRFSIKLLGEIVLSLVEQFYTDEKTIRIVGDMGQFEFLELNKQNPETGMVENDIQADIADFVVDEQNYSATIRQAMFASLGDILTKMDPQVALSLLDLWVDLSDVPGKDVWVERIRKINGQPDPDEDVDDPETAAKAQAREAEEQRQTDLAKRLQEAETQIKEAEAAQKAGEAQKTKVEVQEIMATIDKIVAETMAKRAEVTQKDDELELKAKELKIRSAEALAKIEAAEKADKEDKDAATSKTPTK